MGDRDEGMHQEYEEIILKIKVEGVGEERLEEEEEEEDYYYYYYLSYFRKFICL
jgi:hypothetical protein